eukprot:721162-Hanusia_phi.AAC.1
MEGGKQAYDDGEGMERRSEEGGGHHNDGKPPTVFDVSNVEGTAGDNFLIECCRRSVFPKIPSTSPLSNSSTDSQGWDGILSLSHPDENTQNSAGSPMSNGKSCSFRSYRPVSELKPEERFSPGSGSLTFSPKGVLRSQSGFAHFESVSRRY